MYLCVGVVVCYTVADCFVVADCSTVADCSAVADCSTVADCSNVADCCCSKLWTNHALLPSLSERVVEVVFCNQISLVFTNVIINAEN